MADEKVRRGIAKALAKLRKRDSALVDAVAAAVGPVQASSAPRFSFLKSLSLSGLALGLAAMMLPEYFWFGTCLLHAVLVVTLWDAWTERSISLWTRLVWSMAALALVCFWDMEAVWPPDPFRTSLLCFPVPQVDGNNPPITGLGAEGQFCRGLVWRPEVCQLEVLIINGSHGDYNDLRLDLETDLWIADIIQITRHPNVEMISGGPGPAVFSFAQQGQTRAVARPELQSKSWKIHCDKLRRAEKLEVVLGIVSSAPAIDLTGKPIPLGPMQIPRWLTLSAAYNGRFNRPRSITIERYGIAPMGQRERP